MAEESAVAASAIAQALDDALREPPPRQVLCAGDRAREFLAAVLARHPQTELTHWAGGSPPAGERRYDAAVVVDLPGRLDKAQATALLARLRDVSAGRVFVVVTPEPGGWDEAELIALGFVRIAETRATAGRMRLFAFNLTTYKSTPDWLNPRDWAHPELFDKYRW